MLSTFQKVVFCLALYTVYMYLQTFVMALRKCRNYLHKPFYLVNGGMFGEVKVSCSVCHRGAQFILASSWARPAILVAGKGRGGNVISSVLYFYFPLSYLLSLTIISFSTIFSLYHLSLFSLSIGDCRLRWLTWMRRPTGDQEVAVLTPAKVGNILSWRL